LIKTEKVLVQVELIHSELEERALAVPYFARDPQFEALEGKLHKILSHILISRNEDTGVLNEHALRPCEQVVTGGLDLAVITGITELEQCFEGLRVVFLECDGAVLGFLLDVNVSS
jgi:hypothetical protein